VDANTKVFVYKVVIHNGKSTNCKQINQFFCLGEKKFLVKWLVKFFAKYIVGTPLLHQVSFIAAGKLLRLYTKF
jgi:hypothetical protein